MYVPIYPAIHCSCWAQQTTSFLGIPGTTWGISYLLVKSKLVLTAFRASTHQLFCQNSRVVTRTAPQLVRQTTQVCLHNVADRSMLLCLVGLCADETLMPLLGKRIMITAPRQYASKLAACLITAGARPVWLPSISITRINDQSLGAVSRP